MNWIKFSFITGRACKFRHLKGTPAHISSHIDNIRDLNRIMPGEIDGIIGKIDFELQNTFWKIKSITVWIFIKC